MKLSKIPSVMESVSPVPLSVKSAVLPLYGQLTSKTTVKTVSSVTISESEMILNFNSPESVFLSLTLKNDGAKPLLQDR